MPQTQRLFTSFYSPGTRPVAAPANGQGELLTAPRPGSTWFVNEATGSDTAAGAGNPYTPFKTLAAALALAVAGDTIFITGTVHVSATVVIAQSNLRIVGLNPPSANCRARISQTGSTPFSPLVSVTGQGNEFSNLATFHGFASATTQVCWSDSGGRNFYDNVDFFGGGDPTAAAQAGMRSLLVTGTTGENLFQNCIIGLDTVIRATAVNASLELAAGSPRNIFNDCSFRSNCSLAGDVHVLVGAGGIDRVVEFNNCRFHNFTGGGGTTITADFSVNAGAGGNVLVNAGISVGSTKVSAAGPVYLSGPVPTGATSTLGVLAA